MNGRTKENLRSGELAKLAGVSADTLRFYERKGLIPKPSRSSNGYRLYPAEILHRIRIIQSALAVGFTVQELGRIFHIRNRGEAPCDEVLRIAQQKLLELENRIRHLKVAKKDLQGCVREWKKLLTQTQTGKPARLLERLDQPDRKRRLSPMVPPGLNKNRRIK